MDNLNVKVGDVVAILEKPGAIGYKRLGIVEKVMPNGRFKLFCYDEYWRANGTHNTHASKDEMQEICIKGHIEHYILMYFKLTAGRLSAASQNLSWRVLNLDVDTLMIFNKVLTSFGFKEDAITNKVAEKINKLKYQIGGSLKEE